MLRSLAAAPFALALVDAGRSGVEDDPERYSEAIARTTYERDTGTLYDHASPALRAFNQTAEDPSEDRFGQIVCSVLEDEIPEGEVEADGAQRAPVLPETGGLTFYDVPTVDPEGEQVTINVALIEGGEGSYTYCAVSSRDPGDSWAGATAAALERAQPPSALNNLRGRSRVLRSHERTAQRPCGFTHRPYTRAGQTCLRRSGRNLPRPSGRCTCRSTDAVPPAPASMGPANTTEDESPASPPPPARSVPKVARGPTRQRRRPSPCI